MARLDQVFSRAEPFDPRTSRRVFRIAATDNLERYVLPELAATLQKTAPGNDIRVCALGHDWVAALQRGEIDLKLGRHSVVPDALESEDLSYERFCCVARRGHPARSRPTVEEGHIQGFRRSEHFRPFLAAVQPFVKSIEEMRHYEPTALRWMR